MSRKRNLSCLILCSDSHIDKGFSVKHAIKSIVEQDIDHNNIEIIISENSNNKDGFNELVNYTDKYNEIYPNLIKIVKNEHPSTRAKARNLAAKHAQNEILVFLDDDTIILDNQALNKIREYSNDYDHGYAAVRYWTEGNWFQENCNKLLNVSLNTENIEKNIPEQIYLARTFIGNFGFCSKDSFNKVGGFYEFPEYGCEDDALMFLLYRNDKRVKIMNDISVVHVNHELHRGDGLSYNLYCEFLKSYGVKRVLFPKLFLGATKEKEFVEYLEMQVIE